ncbi:hypothetical protein WJ30_21790 [Burkholderia diffusa]|nr:hypothetical protein WJ30_21790 [Burkholderia diffusa]
MQASAHHRPVKRVGAAPAEVFDARASSVGHDAQSDWHTVEERFGTQQDRPGTFRAMQLPRT